MADESGAVQSPHPEVPLVRGVRLADGSELEADALVDASGRRSNVPGWWQATIGWWQATIGAHAPWEESTPIGVVYYGRHFAVRTGAPEALVAAPGPARVNLGYLRCTLRPTDNRTFIVSFTAPAWHRDLRFLHHERAFMAAARSMPAIAPWVDPARASPLGRVEAMGQLRNTWRRFVVNGAPVALGLHVVGDAVCHTNPSHAKGASLAFAHAMAVADALDAVPHDPMRRAL